MVGCISRPPNLSLSLSLSLSMCVSVSRVLVSSSPFAFSLPCIPLHLRSLENCAELVGEVTVRLWLSREFPGFLCALPLIRRVAGFVFSVLRRAHSVHAPVSLPSTITSGNQEWPSSLRFSSAPLLSPPSPPLSLSLCLSVCLSSFALVHAAASGFNALRSRCFPCLRCRAPRELIARRFAGMHGQHAYAQRGRR